MTIKYKWKYKIWLAIFYIFINSDSVRCHLETHGLKMVLTEIGEVFGYVYRCEDGPLFLPRQMGHFGAEDRYVIWNGFRNAKNARFLFEKEKLDHSGISTTIPDYMIISSAKMAYFKGNKWAILICIPKHIRKGVSWWHQNMRG